MIADLRLGKQLGLRRLATPDGYFTMVALDQRPPIANLVAKRRGIAPAVVTFNDMVDVKRLIMEAVAGHASAVLCDPNFGFPAVLPRLRPDTGLVVTLEEHRFQETTGGRLSGSIRNWSVAKIRRMGADGVKVLAWYRPDAHRDVLEHQQAYVEAVGRQCREHDIPFVLELLVYPFPKDRAHTADYVESPEKMPELVIDSVREFAQPRYGVDLFKLESPWPGATLPARDGGPAQRDVQAAFDEMGDICGAASIPWVMLSAGVTSTQFARVMEYAYAAGANGFLAGRAIWWEPMQQFPDLDACAAALARQVPETVAELEELTRRAARAWAADFGALDGVAAEGEICAAYA